MRMIKLSIQYASLGKLLIPFEATQISLPKLLAALLYYDYSLTWTREVKYIWGRKFTISTALYIACRYALVANVIYTLAISDKLHSLRVCIQFNLFNIYLLTFPGPKVRIVMMQYLLVDKR